MRLFILFTVVSVFLMSCGNQNNKLPNITGNDGEVLIVIDKKYKDAEQGKLLQTYFSQSYPQLPQTEKMFDGIFVASNLFSDRLKTHRSILICTISKTESTQIKVSQNMWAQPQLVMEIFATSGEELTMMIEKNHQKIISYFNEGERKRILENYRKFNNKSITEQILKEFDLNLCVPKGYILELDTNGFAKISNESQHSRLGIFIYTVHGKFEFPVDMQLFIQKRDSVLKSHVPGSLPNSWMVTETEIPLSSDTVWLNEKVFTEIRGLWRMENDYMGGPFLLMLNYDPKTNTSLVIDGFVYAPRFGKRTFVRQLEAIIYSAEIKN